MWSRLLPKNWNDVLSLVMLIGVPLYTGWLLTRGLAEPVLMFLLGVLWAKWGDVVQFYFRKAKGEGAAEA